MIDWQSLIVHYGYIIIFLGSASEGESTVLIGSYLADRGKLLLTLVMMSAIIGSFCGNQLLFYLGRNYGQAWLAKRPKWLMRATRTMRLLEKYQTGFLLLFRFVYGIRVISPVVIGLSQISTRKYLLFNIVGAVAWGIIISLIGYYFGEALKLLFQNIEKYERFVLIGGVVIALAVFFWHRPWTSRKKTKSVR